jgi:hypothetical protein
MTRRRTGAAAAALLAVLVSGCGSSGGGAGGGDTSAPPPSSSSASLASPIAPVSHAVPTDSATAGIADVTRQCSFLTAAEVSAALGGSATVSDLGFRCKYLVGTGYLQLELLDASLANTQQIYDYDKHHGTPVSGIGDEAYIFGAAIVVKVGDVVVALDGNNLSPPAGNAALTTLATKVVSRIA